MDAGQDGQPMGAPFGVYDRLGESELLLQNEYLVAEDRILKAHP
jgi:hypothetical protein